MTAIGVNAFYKNAFLTTFEIPAAVTSIGGTAFDGASQLESLTFASGSVLESVGENAFRNTPKLTSVSLPATVTTLANYAFYVPSLTSVTVYAETPPTVQSRSFYGINKDICVLYVPDVAAYKNDALWNEMFTNIEPLSLSVNEFLVMGQTETVLGIGGYAYNMSANGRYIVSNVTEYDVLWDTKMNTVTNLFSTSELIDAALITDGYAAVNSNGTVAGVYPDTDHVINTPYGDMPAWVAGVWESGTWTSLGLGLIGDDMYNTSSHPYVNGINNDGTKVYGTSFLNRGSLYVPVIWTVDESEAIVRMASPSEQTRLVSVSGDGSVSGGWSVYGSISHRCPIFWTSATEYKLFDYGRG